MGFKNTTRSLDFADLALANCLEQNRSIKLTLLNVLLAPQCSAREISTNNVNLILSVLTNLTGRVQQLNNTINWSHVESILLSHYTVGTSEEGARAYPPLMLFKCLLLQKWFRIQSDPELENQIHPVK